jgi:hypothetical protein
MDQVDVRFGYVIQRLHLNFKASSWGVWACLRARGCSRCCHVISFRFDLGLSFGIDFRLLICFTISKTGILSNWSLYRYPSSFFQVLGALRSRRWPTRRGLISKNANLSWTLNWLVVCLGFWLLPFPLCCASPQHRFEILMTVMILNLMHPSWMVDFGALQAVFAFLYLCSFSKRHIQPPFSNLCLNSYGKFPLTSFAE